MMLMQSAIKIRSFRDLNTLSLEEFGARFGGVKKATVWKWERSERTASARIMKAMADGGVCSMNDWFTPAQAGAEYCAVCGNFAAAVRGCERVGCAFAQEQEGIAA